jgi:hypothetical protein
MENFDSAVKDVCDKFIHSLNLYASIAIGVSEQQLPEDFEPVTKVSLKLVLIISSDGNGSDFCQEWCSPIKKALTDQLKKSDCIAKIWKPDVLAINRENAAARNLIS